MSAEITVRYFAGAQRAAGHDSETLRADTIGELRALLAARAGFGRLAGVVTFLVDGTAAGEAARLLDGAVVDVLPPFAGGSADADRPKADVDVRPQRKDEWPLVADVIQAAFGDYHAVLVAEWFRAQGDSISVVGAVADELVGHVMLSPLPLRTDDGTTVAVLCLSPLSVAPSWQGRGVARRLVEHAVVAVAERSEPVIVLEGNPRLYSRFGFVAAEPRGVRRPSERIPEAAFQMLPLSGYRPALVGQLEYPDYFFRIGAVGP